MNPENGQVAPNDETPQYVSVHVDEITILQHIASHLLHAQDLARKMEASQIIVPGQSGYEERKKQNDLIDLHTTKATELAFQWGVGKGIIKLPPENSGESTSEG